MSYRIKYADGLFAGTYVHQGEKFPYPANKTRKPKEWKTLKGAEKALSNLPDNRGGGYGYEIVEVKDETNTI